MYSGKAMCHPCRKQLMSQTWELSCRVHTISPSDENGPFSSVNRWSWLMVRRAYTPSVKKTIVSERGDVKHDDVLKKNEDQCFQACVDLILSMHGFLTDGRTHRRSFISIGFLSSDNLKTSSYFFNLWINNRWGPHTIGLVRWKRSD